MIPEACGDSLCVVLTTLQKPVPAHEGFETGLLLGLSLSRCFILHEEYQQSLLVHGIDLPEKQPDQLSFGPKGAPSGAFVPKLVPPPAAMKNSTSTNRDVFF